MITVKVNELQVRQACDRIELEIVDLDEPREWNNARGNGTVCSATAKDETGEVKITLWNDDIGKVKKGDKIVIENGWVGEYQGDKQLSTGRFGKLTVGE